VKNYKAPPTSSIGHVHLKVSDLNRSLDFYTKVLGFEITQRYGSSAAFVSAGGYHHHIGLNTWNSLGSDPAPDRAPGLYHLAIVFPSRKDLAAALQNIIDHGVNVDGASDHGVSEAIYFRDPDSNGIEIYWDKPKDQWPFDGNGNLKMVSDALNLNELLGLLKI
jgi:catechol 2,3-dioxygenase